MLAVICGCFTMFVWCDVFGYGYFVFGAGLLLAVVCWQLLILCGFEVCGFGVFICFCCLLCL